jgi:hypothetical protein
MTVNTDGEANNFFGQRVVFVGHGLYPLIPHRLTASLVKIKL